MCCALHHTFCAVHNSTWHTVCRDLYCTSHTVQLSKWVDSTGIFLRGKTFVTDLLETVPADEWVNTTICTRPDDFCAEEAPGTVHDHVLYDINTWNCCYELTRCVIQTPAVAIHELPHMQTIRLEYEVDY